MMPVAQAGLVGADGAKLVGAGHDAGGRRPADEDPFHRGVFRVAEGKRLFRVDARHGEQGEVGDDPDRRGVSTLLSFGRMISRGPVRLGVSYLCAGRSSCR